MTIQDRTPAPADLGRERARRVLPSLLHPGALLIAAPGLPRASVVVAAGDAVETVESFDVAIVDDLAAAGWVELIDPGATLAQYRITPAGRGAAKGADRDPALGDNGAESIDPLDRLRRSDSHPLRRLTDRELAAAAHVRALHAAAGFEAEELLAEWQSFLDEGEWPGDLDGLPDPVAFARSRLRGLLAELGPDLGCSVARVVCLWHLLTRFESDMGLPARSGKAIVKAALRRVARHVSALPPRGASRALCGDLPAPSRIRAEIMARPEGERLDYAIELLEYIAGPDEIDATRLAELGLRLSPAQVRLLAALDRRRGRPVSREALGAAGASRRSLSEDEGPKENVLDVHVSHLRKRIREAGLPIEINAVWGFGYRLDAPADLDLGLVPLTI
ncbi:DUF6456 domain-containing protein [Rhodovulum marinum]|uniref:Transcriptional regulator n=1 Tax=Rhodovulum marinum TaxID=320662 RepID=A0A4R2Q599_9RHOB|nr:DUF6456 domain-containing protein [Rhodovulum marinum]TCP43952.1 transcriptional regulator [Rhodovulum marinum]